MEDLINGIFEDMLTSAKIFESKEVLGHAYTPHYLPHRSEQIKSLAMILVAG